MTNLEKSELVIAKILGLLMEWGLSAANLRFEELELEPDYLPFFATCVDWLESEGVIRTRSIQRLMDGRVYVNGPTITAHGLKLMGKSLTVGGATTTIGEAVQKTSKESSYYTGVGDIAGGFVGGLLKSLGSS